VIEVEAGEDTNCHDRFLSVKVTGTVLNLIYGGGMERRQTKVAQAPSDRSFNVARVDWRHFTVSIPFLPDRGEPLRLTLTDGGVIACGSVLLAALLAITTDLGEAADLSFYATVAQVIPVFLLAMIVEVRSRLGRSFNFAASALHEQWAMHDEVQRLERRLRDAGNRTPELQRASVDLEALGTELAALTRDFHDDTLPGARRVVRGYVIAAVPGLVGALVALAVGHGSTFWFSLSALSLASMLVLFARRVGHELRLPDEMASRVGKAEDVE
jgi:hypothetical protein